jgi:hypothetical protein
MRRVASVTTLDAQRVSWQMQRATPRTGRTMTDSPKKPKKPHSVYTLVVEVGRKSGDGLPDGATGAGLMCYASGVDEAEAVRETVAILKQADMAPLDVTGYGTLEERKAQGHEIDAEEIALMQQALDENAVIVAQVTPYFGERDKD